MKNTQPDDCSHSELDAARLALILIVGALAAERHAEDLRRQLASIKAEIDKARKEVIEAVAAEELAETMRKRAETRLAEAKTRRDRVVAMTTPREENRRRNRREAVRQKRIADGRKTDNPDLMALVVKRDEWHSAIYRDAADRSFADEQQIIANSEYGSYGFPCEYCAERVETSPNRHCLAISFALYGIDPRDFIALAASFSEYALKQALGVRQKPYREAVISHPIGVEVTDDWFVFQAVRHLAAQGIPPESVPWILGRHSGKTSQHAHLFYVPVEIDGTTYVSPYAVVASALETARQDAWAEIPPGRLNAPTSKLKDIRNGYRLAAEGNLHSFRVSYDGKTREKIPLQGSAAAEFRLDKAGAPHDQHGHTGGTFTLLASASASPISRIIRILGQEGIDSD